MPRVQAVWDHPLFQKQMDALARAEADRRFCRHGIAHLLDVARVAWILNLERGWELDREMVYAAALLHDIGRAAQYASGVPHDVAGEQLAVEILGTVKPERRFSSEEQAVILAAVRGHRDKERGLPDGSLAAAIADADHASRACFACDARNDCYWSDERKNLAIRI